MKDAVSDFLSELYKRKQATTVLGVSGTDVVFHRYHGDSDKALWRSIHGDNAMFFRDHSASSVVGIHNSEIFKRWQRRLTLLQERRRKECDTPGSREGRNGQKARVDDDQ